MVDRPEVQKSACFAGYGTVRIRREPSEVDVRSKIVDVGEYGGGISPELYVVAARPVLGPVQARVA